MNKRLFVLIITLATVCLAACAGAPQPGTPTAAALPSATPRPTTAINKLGLTGTPVEVDIVSYRLVVDGLVEHPLSLSYEQLLAYPAVSRLMVLECPGVFVDYAEWTGPLLRTILEQAGVRPEAREVVFFDGDPFPYEKRVSLDEALGDNMILAYQVNGQTLPVDQGYPLRLAAGGKLGDVWVKWLFRIEVQ